jgi:AcrR family transcriptional regulator
MRNQGTALKEEIIEKSVKLFLQKGYNATRVEDITTATNVSKAAFYVHFKSKNELLETIIDRYESIFIDQAIRVVRKSREDFLRRIKYNHKWVTEFAYSNPELCVAFLTISAEMVGSGTTVEAKIRAIKSKYRAFIKELLELGRKEGKIKENLDLDLAAHIINALHDGILFEWYTNRDEVDGGRLAVTYREIELSGILK